MREHCWHRQEVKRTELLSDVVGQQVTLEDDGQDTESDAGGVEIQAVTQQAHDTAGAEAPGSFPHPVHLSARCVLRDVDAPPDNPLFHGKAVVGVALSADCQTASSGGNDMQVKQWDVERGSVTLRMGGHQGWIWHLVAEDDSNAVLLTGSTDSSVRVWDTRVGRQVQQADVASGGQCQAPALQPTPNSAVHQVPPRHAHVCINAL